MENWAFRMKSEAQLPLSLVPSRSLMRIAAIGAFVVAGLVVATLAMAVQADMPVRRAGSSVVGGSSQLVTLSTPLGNDLQQVVLVDPELQVMSVYHINLKGEIELMSVRNFHWDLQMEQFNGSRGLMPKEIRAQLQRP